MKAEFKLPKAFYGSPAVGLTYKICIITSPSFSLSFTSTTLSGEGAALQIFT